MNTVRHYCCDKAVKEAISGHSKCCRTRNNKPLLGKYLNSLVGQEILDSNTVFNVCSLIFFKCKDLKPLPTRNVANQPVALPKVVIHADRDWRERPLDLSKLKVAFVKISGKKRDYIDRHNMSVKKRREDHVVDKINASFDFRKSFEKINWRERDNRVDAVCIKILNCCVDKRELKEQGLQYLQNNNQLAIVINNFLAFLKERMSKWLQIPLLHLDKEVLTYINDDSAALNQASKNLTLDLLNETSKHTYDHLIKTINKFTSTDLPSYYKVQKDCGINVEEFKFGQVKETSKILQFGDSKNNNIMLVDKTTTQSNDDETATDSANIDNNEEYNDEVLGARLQQSYSDSIKTLVARHDKVLSNDDRIMVIDSYDGAEHIRTKKNVTSVISYNSTIMNKNLLEKGLITTSASNNIITWQQTLGKENLPTMIASTKNHYIEKYELESNLKTSPSDHTYTYYDLHDLKMSYLLTQHGQWSRKEHPFFLCHCNRGDGPKNLEHECRPVIDEDQIKYYEKSFSRWQSKKVKLKPYSYKDHVNWCATKNVGITHFGVHPQQMKRSKIRIDVFHMKCSITKTIMSYIRDYILSQSQSIIEGFTKILQNFWGRYQISIWNTNKPFSSFIGSELSLFIGNAKEIKKFFSEHLSGNVVQDVVIKALEIVPEIFMFLGITIIKDTNEYINLIKKYEGNVKSLYEIGKDSFLSRGGHTGDAETIYMHCLRFYLPRIIKETYEKEGLGVGIFTMQGFERRNKESKKAVGRFSNNKGNILINNIRKLHTKLY